MPGLGLIVLGRALEVRPTGQVVAFVAFGVALFLGIAWLNARTAHNLQKEIDALDAS